MGSMTETRPAPPTPQDRYDRFVERWARWWYERTPAADVAPWDELTEGTRRTRVASWGRMFTEVGLEPATFKRPAEPIVAARHLAAELDYIVARVGAEEAPDKRQLRLMDRIGALGEILRGDPPELLPSVRMAIAGLDKVLNDHSLTPEHRGQVLAARTRLEAIGMRWRTV